MIKEFSAKLRQKNDLTYEETRKAMDEILSGSVSDDDSAEFLKHLTLKGETDDELLGMLDKMHQYSLKITPMTQSTLIDVCGTGGDSMKTFNISTAASFVIAASGGAVAKHGNRSVSGVSGSADIFEFFGYDLNSKPEKITEIIEKFGIGFMFAQKFHPAMKNVANARKKVGGRTAFNLLGPLTNPAQVQNQLIGVFSEEFLKRIPNLLKQKGAENIMTVRSEDGLDEFSTSAKNKVCFLKNGEINSMIVDPQSLGFEKSNLSNIQIVTKEDAISAFVSVLRGTANQSMLDITSLNAAGGLIVGNVVADFSRGIDVTNNIIKNGKAFDLFSEFIEYCGDSSKIKEVLN